MLTIRELELLRRVIGQADENDWDVDTYHDVVELDKKLAHAISQSIAIQNMKGLARPEGTLIENITPEEAMEYSQRGEMLMLAAARNTVSEHVHARLASIMTGLVSAICRLGGLPRIIFCNDLMSNVLFAALKAAYNEGSNGGEVDNGNS